MKTGNFHASFDPLIYNEFQSIIGKGNVSRTFQEFMSNTIATHNKDISGINLKILNSEIDDLQRKFNKIQAKLQQKREIRDKIEQKNIKEKEEKLKMEAETIKKQNSCVKCANLINENAKSHKVNKGILCNACFVSTPPQDLKEWLS